MPRSLADFTRRPGTLCSAVIVLAVTVGSAVEACNVPVFRYALEHWAPDAYRAILYHRGELSEEMQVRLQTLRARVESSRLNLSIRTADLAATPQDSSDSATLPRLVIQYPPHMQMDEPVWVGAFEDAALSRLLDSPVRREVVERLAQGQTAVWLMIDSGHAIQDEAAAQTLAQELKHLATSLKLPELTDSPDDAIQGGPALRIEFSLLRVRRDDPAEQALIAMLLSCEPDLATLDEPCLFPLFGRSRVMLPLVGEGISADNIRESAKFLVGACSCQVKELNPGFDLLLAADWSSLLPWAKPIELASRQANAAPEFVPIPPGARPVTPAAGTVAGAPASTSETGPATDSEKFGLGGMLVWGVCIVLGVGVIVVASRRLASLPSLSPGGRSGGAERQGSSTIPVLVMLASLAVLGLLIASMMRGGRPDAAPQSTANVQPLHIHCAASNKNVMEAIRADYERTFGRKLEIQYGSSQSLLTAIEVSRTGDLFLPADDSYLEIAQTKRLLTETFELATMHAVVAVPQGNPHQITRLADLLQPGLRIAQANPDGAAIGKLTREKLTITGEWERLHTHTTVFKSTVNEVANDVKVGAVDAGIVFDAVLHGYDSLDAVTLPELAPIKAQIGLGLLVTSSQPTAAIHFARYASARDKGLELYRRFGFQPADGDIWSEEPQVTLYAGSMLRPAIEETITSFEQREGARVTRVYNGCGILVAQMKSGSVPDAYFACDVEFMNQVREMFPTAEEVSQNELVILVKKGNPLGIKSLQDLTRPGLRVGIGHEKQCAMGWLTQRTFSESGLQSEVMKNVAVQTPTGDMLVNQMRSGSLDAAVAYLSNAAGAADALDAIRIHGIPCSVATQPFGIAAGSANQKIAARLLRALRAESSGERFASEGFRWLVREPEHD